MATLTPHQVLARRDREMIPKPLLRAMLGLVIACVALVTYARVTDRPLEAKYPEIAIRQERQIILTGDTSGAAKVIDADTGAVIADLPGDKGGFISGVSSVIVRERTLAGVPIDAPVRLMRFADGRLGLRDDLTGFELALIGFGRDNTAAFARLMP